MMVIYYYIILMELVYWQPPLGLDPQPFWAKKSQLLDQIGIS